ncbi:MULTISPECIES: T9SS type A sorting domain-containing protein [unclassified Lacinutrix]
MLIQTNRLAKGVYIIKITNENNVISRKVLLE